MGVAARAVLGGVEVLTLDDGSGMPASDAPRPVAHPIRTLGGTLLTAVAPEDHVWHAGFSLAIPSVDGVNLWGGNSYAPGVGYRMLDDHGRQRLAAATPATDGVDLRIDWLAPDGSPLLVEERALRWRALGRATWELEARSALSAVGAAERVIGSPGSAGRAGAGYGGWFWRMPPCSDVDVTALDGNGDVVAAGEDAVNGLRASALRWTGALEGARVGLRFESDAEAPDPWFVRVAEYPAVGTALAWNSPLVVPASAPLTRRLRVEITDD